MLLRISTSTGLSPTAVGLALFVCFVVALLSIISLATKPKQVKSTNKRTNHLRGKHEFVHRPSLLDSGMALLIPWRTDTPRSNIMHKSVFRGWFNLCWIIISAWNLQYFVNNYKTKGYIIGNLDWFLSLFHSLHELILVLLPIYALSFLAFFLQKLMIQDIFGKKYTRSILHFAQHLLQTVMIFGIGMFVFFFCEHWPFTQKLALVIETLCLYMKMHSYMLSNQELYEMKYGIHSNKKTDDITVHTVQDIDKMSDEQVMNELGYRGLRNFSWIDMKNTVASNFCYYEDDTQVNIYGFESCYRNKKVNEQNTNSTAQYLLNGNVRQLHEDIERLKQREGKEMANCYRRLVLKDTVFLEDYRRQIYPQNVTLYNWFEFTLFPTLVYEPLYPRTTSVRVMYVMEKVLVFVAVMSFMFTIIEKFMLDNLSQQSKSEPIETIINLLVPVTLMEICCFFVVFDCMLNCIAELTCFADREFYQDWWNSTSFEEFARKWNRPVHEFLLRHVYFESMNTYKFSKGMALAGTFVFSIALHEVVLCACLHQFNPVLALMSMWQLPLIPIMKSPVFRHKPLGNIIFWVGIMLGMPMACVLYAREYCATYDCTVSYS
eukprot:293552_1